jgi:large subunit ribosomal protein L35Ae
MKARIVSFRRGRHNFRPNQLLLEVQGLDSKAKASKLIGKKVVWVTPGKKQIHGKIAACHGNNGVVRARFSKGLPGTAIGKDAEILEK